MDAMPEDQILNTLCRLPIVCRADFKELLDM